VDSGEAQRGDFEPFENLFILTRLFSGAGSMPS
jgi:hypothetical protein